MSIFFLRFEISDVIEFLVFGVLNAKNLEFNILDANAPMK